MKTARLNASSSMGGQMKTRGMTLVELLVTMAVGFLVVAVAVAAWVASQRGAREVDAASQLRDDARFAASIIQRLGVQTGFEDLKSATQPYYGTESLYKSGTGLNIADFMPSVFGYNNGIPSASDPVNNVRSRPARSEGYGSDVLILQNQVVKLDPKSSLSDKSMINCMGDPPSKASINRKDRIVSIFYLGKPAGETGMSLMCATQKEDGTYDIQPLIKNVETFQVLYGVDNVAPNKAPTGHSSSVPNGYLRADQLTVAGDPVATYTNWRRVRSLRIGLVLQGPRGTAPDEAEIKHYPFGDARYANSADPGSEFVTKDNRLHQTVTFTVQLRNCQNQGFQPESSTVPCDVVVPTP